MEDSIQWKAESQAQIEMVLDQLGWYLNTISGWRDCNTKSFHASIMKSGHGLVLFDGAI